MPESQQAQPEFAALPTLRRRAGLGVSLGVHAVFLLLLLLVRPMQESQVEPPPVPISVTFAEPEPPPIAISFAPPGSRDAGTAPDAVPSDFPPNRPPVAPAGEPAADSAASDGPAALLPAAQTPSPQVSREPRDPQPPGERSPEPRPATPPPEPFTLSRALAEFGENREARAVPKAGGSNRAGVRDYRSEIENLPFAGAQLGELEFSSRDYDWADYQRQIYIAIWRAWHARLLATAGEFEKWAFHSGEWYLQHRTRVRFTIERSGAVSDVAVDTASGCEPLDQSAVDALREVILPPLPDDFPRDRELVRGRFIAQGEVRSLRPTLTRLRAAGYF